MPDLKPAPWQHLALTQPFDHFAMLAGIATGKTYTGAHFAIKMLKEHPELTGFIGANTYDQLSQATLRELFYWLDEYEFEYVVDCQPPQSWGSKKKFKKYSNIISVRQGDHVTHIFTRVLGKGNPLRGIEFSWYWIDETRDTPRDTHDVILSRLRESKEFRKGLVTTTTNGEDWVHDRFVKGRKHNLNGKKLYGSMHVRTIKSVEAGIISQDFYDALLQSYSPMMAEQELNAQHVNVEGGRAYYAAGPDNALHVAPWGDTYPNIDRPLIIGCDFNFSPAPLVWMVGQLSPDGDSIHWFNEMSGVEVGTRQMTVRVMQQFPNFFYRVFGDMSGNQGTTSNAGHTDYHQMGDEFSEAGVMFSIDAMEADPSESKSNPRVKLRVENMNAMFKNALGEIRQTYNPEMCPLLDGDIRVVGWKPNILMGRGKLDDNGDKQRTHASDGAGYAVFRLFPPGRRVEIIESLPSVIRKDLEGVF